MTRVYSQTLGGRPPYSNRLLPAPLSHLHTNVTTVGHSEPGNPLDQTGRPNFAGTAQKCCGIIQVCLGIVAVPLGGAAWAVKDGLITFLLCGGFIAGFFFIIGGSLAIDSTRTEKYSLIVACLVMSVFSAFFGFCYLCISCAGLWFDFTPEMDIWKEQGPIGIIDAFGAFVGLVGMVVAIIQVVICSRTVCGCCVKETLLVFVTSEMDPSSPTSTTPLVPSLDFSINTTNRSYQTAQRSYASII